MLRVWKLLLVLLAAAVILAGAEWTRERFTQRRSDLRVFDAAAVGKLDTDMWRSYYERRPFRLFEQMITLLRAQYGMRPLEALTNAYRAAHAAFVFKDGRSRADYQKALPDLEAYYADIAERSGNSFDPHRAAALELEWWIVHRERPPGLPAALAALESEIYGIPPQRFQEHARLRAEAMDLRDGKGASITEADWHRIGDLLDASWKSLHMAVNPGNGSLHY